MANLLRTTSSVACAFASALALSNADHPLATYSSATVIEDLSSPLGVKLVAGLPDPGTSALAWGSYNALAMNTTGWATLNVATNATSANQTLISYAAGYLEGTLTWNDMVAYASNTGATAKNSKGLQTFLDENWKFMRKSVDEEAGKNPYWWHVGAIMAQVQGLADGQAAAGGSLDFRSVYNAIIQGGDIFNLAPIYGVSDEQLVKTNVIRRMAAAGRLSVPSASRIATSRADHCSALVRLMPDNDDVGVSHTTWSGFQNMLRIMKTYDMALPIDAVAVPGRYTTVSSYPTFPVYSSDDFYVMLPSGLISTETTIDNDNATLAKQFASHKVVLEWARNVLANRLATDGASWASLFSQYASGTYTNSWMILDTNKFKTGFTPGANMLTVVEEMPGHISVQDRTSTLVSQGFWSSYNVPSDPAIFNISGQWALVDEYEGPTGPGAYFTFANTSRANIFRRDAPKVTDESSLRAMIRYNDFQHDPLSTLGCGTNPPYSATNAIADRSDLNMKGGDYVIPGLGHGDAAGIDAKYSLASWVKAAVSAGSARPPLAAQSGPTYDQQPVFSFSNATIKAEHVGMPDVWHFPWIKFD